MNAVAYLRVSGRGQIDGDGFTRQSEAIRVYAARTGHQVEREFREEGVTGKAGEADRPAFTEMVSLLLAGNGTRTILVESMDRLAREYRIQEQLLIYLASKGLELISCNTGENVTQAIAADPMRKAMVQIQGIFAELDRSLLVAKLRKARVRRRAAGERCEGRKPFGSLPGEEQVVRQIVSLSQTQTARQIAEALNADGVSTRMGRVWHPRQVRRIVKRNKPG